MSLFYDMAEANDLAGLKQLHQLGENPDAPGFHGRTALHVAARENRISTIVWLLRLGADFEITDDHGITALRTAAESGSRDAVFVLLAAGASPELCAKDGVTPFHAAVLQGHADVVVAFLDAGADPNFPMKIHPNGHTALDISIAYEADCREHRPEKVERYQAIGLILAERGGLTLTPFEP